MVCIDKNPMMRKVKVRLLNFSVCSSFPHFRSRLKCIRMWRNWVSVWIYFQVVKMTTASACSKATREINIKIKTSFERLTTIFALPQQNAIKTLRRLHLFIFLNCLCVPVLVFNQFSSCFDWPFQWDKYANANEYLRLRSIIWFSWPFVQQAEEEEQKTTISMYHQPIHRWIDCWCSNGIRNKNETNDNDNSESNARRWPSLGDSFDICIDSEMNEVEQVQSIHALTFSRRSLWPVHNFFSLRFSVFWSLLHVYWTLRGNFWLTLAREKHAKVRKKIFRPKSKENKRFIFAQLVFYWKIDYLMAFFSACFNFVSVIDWHENRFTLMRWT